MRSVVANNSQAKEIQHFLVDLSTLQYLAVLSQLLSEFSCFKRALCIFLA